MQNPNLARPRRFYQLRVSGNVGDCYVYESETHVKSDQVSDSFDVRGKSTLVLARKANGTLEWENTFQIAEISGKGKLRQLVETFQRLNKVKTTSVKDDRGQLLKVIVDDTARGSKGGGDLTFPERMVSIGDTWQAPIGVSGKIVTAEYTLAKVFDHQGKPTAAIESIYLPGQDVHTLDKNVFWVDISTGLVIFSKTSAKFLANGENLSVISTVKLVESLPGVQSPAS